VCIRSLCSLSSLLICTVVSQVALLPSYNNKTIVSLQIVHQVTLLPSFTGNLHCCKSGHCAPFLQQSVQQQIVLSIRLLCSLPTMVCTAADSVVHQVSLLLSNNSLCHSKQYYASGRCAPFLHW